MVAFIIGGKPSRGRAGPCTHLRHTMDTAECRQTDSGVGRRWTCQIVRITAPTVKDAANLKKHRPGVARWRGFCAVPIVADIHFQT